MKCKIEDCNNDASYKANGRRGLCNKHRQRDQKYGDPLKTLTAGTGEPMRFIQETAVGYKSSDCLIWPFYRHQGYAYVAVDRQPKPVSRVVCEIVHGKPPSRKYEAAHSCGNGHLGCVNPLHLRWATSAENKADQLLHGTRNRGARNGRSKLTEAVVRQIKAEAASGRTTHDEIAKRFGITRVAVTNIHIGRNWGHLFEP